MLNLLAHAGHPGDSDNPIIHGIAHWIFSLPILLAIVIGLASVLLWKFNQPKQVNHQENLEDK